MTRSYQFWHRNTLLPGEDGVWILLRYININRYARCKINRNFETTKSAIRELRCLNFINISIRLTNIQGIKSIGSLKILIYRICPFLTSGQNIFRQRFVFNFNNISHKLTDFFGKNSDKGTGSTYSFSGDLKIYNPISTFFRHEIAYPKDIICAKIRSDIIISSWFKYCKEKESHGK